MKDNGIHENLIEILDYKLCGELPNPFVFENGEAVKTKEDWAKRREEIYETTINLQYGKMPPKPEFLEVEPICLGGIGSPSSYRITTGTRANPLSFIMYVYKANASELAPAVVTGDLCFKYAFDKEYINTFIDNGINLVLFNRTELAPDVAGYNIDGLKSGTNEKEFAKEVLGRLTNEGTTGPLKKTYPDYDFGSVAAWAWGYSRCVDALEILGNVDMDTIVFTGHSRGGKAAALAGAVDERAAIVNPNASCSGGYGSYRIKIKAKTESGEIEESEPLSNIYRHFPTWLGSGMKKYIDKEQEIPFDSHYLKALVAPRVLFVSEAASDIMANPVGSYQTTEAASEVFKFLGCEQNLIWYFRKGDHYQNYEDIAQLVNVIKHFKEGKELNQNFFRKPFGEMPEAFSWKCPK
ncbi:MAG: hypothetical protein E7560_03575 [Ruminococcaceae bacterium]|nr:hypothetical protein [Oscillospiraceae bacterium]